LFVIFWIFWCKKKITQADAPTIWMGATPLRRIGAPTSAICTIFMQDTFLGTTLPIYPGLGQAPNMLACLPGGLVFCSTFYLIFEPSHRVYNAAYLVPVPSQDKLGHLRWEGYLV